MFISIGGSAEVWEREWVVTAHRILDMCTEFYDIECGVTKRQKARQVVSSLPHRYRSCNGIKTKKELI